MKTESESNKTIGWIMNAEFVLGNNPERQEYALNLYASWLIRVILGRLKNVPNTSHSSAITENHALTSEPVNCTVGTPSSCKSGGSNE